MPEAREAVIAARGLAVRIGADDLVAAADDDRGRVELVAGNYAEATDRFAAALTGSGPFSRALARRGRAEALARLERADDAERELRETVLEPVTPGDWPDTLVARLTRVQGLIALARGDRDMAVMRLTEAADGWRRHLGSRHAGSAGPRHLPTSAGPSSAWSRRRWSLTSSSPISTPSRSRS